MNNQLTEKIKELKKQRNALILVHNYQRQEVQDIADFKGDSLELSRKAAATDADVIVFCGVHFMAETASILSPQKKVLLPDLESGCPMADMITREQLIQFKKKNPGATVVTYINSTAEVKAETDICCTSSNAVKVVKSIHNDKIIFCPDRNLGSYVQKVLNKKLILWQGFCPTHMRMLPEYVIEKKRKYPKAVVLVHPECQPETVALADEVLSTTGIMNYVKSSGADEFIIGTENEITFVLRRMYPDKIFHTVSDIALCPNMKKNTLEKVLWTLQDMKNEIRVPENIREKAYKPIKRMLDIF
ncbi:MAG: quinolinate synthase NadA [Endomicrobiaceae bacterium]|jgi:quinolinate synthase|nr:quinolinate synthase NadA [Endomicrobiaceae bacterium]MDD3729505.1 quinolinate synthase NadA [Endomicrobiaceae bacterium]MDD4165760.1 quinolinate synthase NadA [Endomicrobiaceae bacterium]